MIVELCFAFSAAVKAPAVSSESHGRMYSRFGIARYNAASSIG